MGVLPYLRYERESVYQYGSVSDVCVETTLRNSGG